MGSDVPPEDQVLRFAGCFNTLGVIKAENGELDSALVYFDSAASYAPEHAAVLGNLGNCYACRGELTKAIEHYERSFALDSLEPAVLCNWSIVMEFFGRPEEAAQLMQQFIDIEQSQPSLLPVLLAHIDIGPAAERGAVKADEAEIPVTVVRRLYERALSRQLAFQQAMKSADSLKSPTAAAGATSNDTVSQNLRPVLSGGTKAVDLEYLARILIWRRF